MSYSVVVMINFRQKYDDLLLLSWLFRWQATYLQQQFIIMLMEFDHYKLFGGRSPSRILWLLVCMRACMCVSVCVRALMCVCAYVQSIFIDFMIHCCWSWYWRYRSIGIHNSTVSLSATTSLALPTYRHEDIYVRIYIHKCRCVHTYTHTYMYMYVYVDVVHVNM